MGCTLSVPSVTLLALVAFSCSCTPLRLSARFGIAATRDAAAAALDTSAGSLVHRSWTESASTGEYAGAADVVRCKDETAIAAIKHAVAKKNKRLETGTACGTASRLSLEPP